MFTKANRFKTIASGNFLVANFSSLSLFFVQNFSFSRRSSKLNDSVPLGDFLSKQTNLHPPKRISKLFPNKVVQKRKIRVRCNFVSVWFFFGLKFFCRKQPNCRNYFEPSMRSSSSSSWWTQSGWVCSSCTLSSFAASWTSGGRLPRRPRPRLRLSLFRLGSRGRTPYRRASSSCRRNTSRRDSPTTSRTVW